MKMFILMLIMIPLTKNTNSQFLLTGNLNNNVKLIADPPFLIEGLATQVDIDCTFKREDVPFMASVMSMMIGHANKTDQLVFENLASVNGIDGHTNNDSHDVNIISGSIDNNGESKLHIRFIYPETHLIGLYIICEVTGFDQIGKPVSIYSSINAMTINISYLLSILDKAKLNITALDNAVDGNQTCINNQIRFSETMLKLQNAVCTNYYPPIFYNGHIYYLSQKGHFNYTEMQSKCEVFGGYLVELDTHDEFTFIRDYLSEVLQFNEDIVWTGATDEGHEGVWINNHNSTVRPTFDWTTNEPGWGDHCQCFGFASSWKLYGCSCYDEHPHFHYICEIPREIC